MCNQPGCPSLAEAQYCHLHAPTPWAGKHSRRSIPRKLRRTILERDMRFCYLCHRPGATEVDHVTPRSRGGTDDPNNLRAVHKHCHAKKTAAESAAARWANY